MNEEVLQDLFNRAVSKGYNKSIEEFTVLLSQNNDVLIDNFNYVKGKGYKKTIEDFKTLTGVVEGVNTTDSEVKKKDESVSTSPKEVMGGGTQVVEELGSLEPSVQEDEVVTEEIEYQPGVDAQGIEMGFSEDYLTTIKKAKDQGLNEYETIARVQSQQLKEDQELETETQWDRSVKSLTQGLEVADDEFLGWLDNKKKTSRDTKITDSEEEQVRYRMEYLFEDYGYEFEEFGVGDNIKITAPGSEQWVKDNPDAKEEDNPYIFKTNTDSGREWFELTKKAVSSVNPGTFIASNLLYDTSEDGKSYELAQFMERTKPASALSRNRMDEIIADNSIYNSKVMNMEQKDEITKAYQTDNDEMVMDTNDFLERHNEVQKEGEYFSQFTPLEIKQKGLEQQYGEFLNSREQLKVEGKALDERMEGLKKDGPSLDIAVGEYIKSREKIGSFAGGLAKSIPKGYGIVFAGATGLAIDITSAKYAALLIAKGMPAKDAFAKADAWSKKTKGFGKGGGSYTPFSKVANQYVSQDQKGLQQLIRDRGSEVGDKIGTETSKEYIDSAGFIEGSLYGVAESVPAMMTGVGGLFTMAVDIVNQETENNPLFKDISELEKLAIAAPIGVVGAALEKFGLSKALKGKALTQQATLYMLKKFGAKATTKSFSEFVDYEMRTGGTKLLTKSLMGGLSEAETGGLQEVSDKVFKNIYNEIKGQELFQETDTWAQFFYEVGEAAVAEGIGGTAIGSVGSVVNGATGGNFGEVSNETFALFKDLMNDPYLKGAYEIKIKRKIITGEITKAEAKRQMQAAEVIAGVMSEIPDSYSEENQRKALQLLLEKKALEDKISKSNKLLVKGLQDRVDGIDNSLEAIGEANDLAVELMSDEEVDLPQEIKDLNDDEVYTFTVETLEDVPESQRGNAEKVEGAEITTRQTILGVPVGPETTIKSGGGYTYTITGKEAKINANAIQESSTKDVDVQEPSTDSGEMGEGDTEVQPSVTGETKEEGESESDTTQTAEEKIEAAEDAKKLFEEEMGESGTDPESEPETVLPKVTPEKLEPVVSDENLSITEEVDGESDPYYETEEFSSSPEGGVTPKQHENRILKRAEKAVKAIKKILPKTKIILHRSEAAYTKAINAKKGDSSSGSYVYNNKDGTGTIHVNVPRANKRTIAHEVFHAVLISKYKGNEAEIRSITKRMLAAVKKNVKDRALKNKLQEFSDGYEKFNDEEYLAELVGFLGDNYNSLGPKGKNIIKRWLEKIGEILGREPEINVDADVLELLNTIGKSVKRGEEIQGDVIDKSFSQIETEVETETEAEVEAEVEVETEVETEVEAEVETKINWTKKKSAPQKSSPSKIKQIQEKLRTLVKKYESGKITIEEYNKQADDIIPVKMKEVFVEPVNEEELIDGLKSKKDKTNSPIQEGTDVSLRIDIPFMKRTGKSSVTIHERRSPKDITGRVLSYVGSAVIENVEFLINPKQSLAFASDNKVHKSANLGRMGGTLVDIGSTIEEQNATAKKLAQQAISEGWTQVGINPSKHSYFYDRSTGKPLKSADRVVQVGDLIYAENAKTTTVYDDMFIVKGKTDKKGGPLRFQKPTQRQQKTVEGLREGKMTTTTPVKIYKGIGGKKDIRGQRINAHKGVKGIFSAVDKKLAEEYGREEGVAEIDLPSGVTIEVVEVATKGLDPKQYRAAEVKAINESDAQVVKLITIEGKVKGLLRNGDGKQQQYIIKDFDLVPELKAEKPTTRQQRTERLAPNGKRSNLTDVQYDTVRTKAFKNWFGDWENDPANASKVVDENGEPMVMYHGSPVLIDEFNPSFTGKGNDQLGSGFYFTTNESEAKGYSKKSGEDGVVLSTFLKIQNPIRTKGMNLVESDVELTKKDVVQIIKKSPLIYDKQESPIGDWIPEYWNQGTKDWMIEEVAENFVGSNLLSLNNDFFSGYETAFREALVEVMGRDGVKQDFQTETTHYVAYLPNQIKAADGSNVTFDPDAPSIRQQKTGSVYFSNALKAIGNIKDTNPKQPVQWVRILSDTQKNGGVGGVNQELSWIGLEDYLNEWTKENKAKSVPKEVVEQYIDDNQIEIVEVGKGGSNLLTQKDIKEVRLIEGSENNYEVEYKDGFIDKIYNARDKEDASYVSISENNRSIEEDTEDTKYSKYQLEGGENYQEVLLTLPNNKGQKYADKMRSKYGENLNPVEIYEKMSEQEQETQAKLNNESEVSYKSRHWDESNILAHIRMNERVLPNGEKVMFIEEIQSDWAQEGKKKGFVSNLFKGNFRSFVEKEKGLRLNQEELLAEFNNRQGELKQEFLERTDRGKTPDMPYKKTDQWVGLAIRRVMKMASDKGFDRIAWVTGEQSADRYSLAEQVDRIDTEKNKFTENERTVYIYKKGEDEQVKLTVDENTNKVIESIGIDANGKGLDDVIGKEMAKKVMDSKGSESFEGDGLKVGGEGMKTFYNSILPKVAKKEAQRFDKKAKIEVVDFNSDLKKQEARLIELNDQIKKENNPKKKASLLTERIALLNERGLKKINVNKPSNQLSIALTPKMNQELEGGIGVQRQQKVVRFQDTIKKSDTPIDIIKKAVALGIDQKVVLNDLLKNYSTLNAKQRKELLAVNIDLFTSVPDAFLNVKGGYKKGIALFKKINDKIKKLNEDKNNKLTEQQVVEKAIEFLRNTSEYKAEADFVKSKGKLRAKAEASTQQLKMEAEFQKSLKDFRPSKDLAKRLRDIKAKITQRIKGGRDLQEVKRQLRNYIRQSLPLGEYTKSDVVKLIREITALTTKELSGRQLETTMMRISSFVAKKNIKNLITKLDKLLDVSDLTKIESGTLKGKKVSNEVRKRIIAIKESMPKPAEGADVLGDRIDKWNERINEFQKNPINTPAEIKEMADLQVMIDLTNAYMQDTFSGIDPDIEQVATLESVIQGLESLRREGKSELEKEMATQRRKYLEDFQVAYEDINQVKINLIPTEFTTDDAKKALKDEGVNDPTDDQIYDKISELNEAEAVRIRKELDSLSKQTSEKKSKLMAKAKISVKNLALKIPEYIDRYLNREETLQGLMAIISKGPGELFGGKMRELVYDKINKALIQYKSRDMKIKADITSNMKRIFGKNWESINRKNSIAKTTGVYKNVEEVNKAKKDYRKNPTQENKKKLKEVIKLNNIVLSPNQIYYQYNQYQDPANIKSFANEENTVFGEDHERIMKELYATLNPKGKGDELSPIQEFAKYQREVLFPSLYDHYNSVYKKIYRTDMPWNQFYAGRIYRDGDKADIKEVDPLMLNGMSKFNQTIGPASTKSRVDNSTPISYMDGTDTMMNYISDMEWFAAFGESIRDISKIFSNNDIKKSIELNHSPDMLKLINSSINKIAAKGLRQGASNALINGTNNIFVLRSLGLSATVALKQLTSIPTYANVIGPVNYLKYAVKNKAEMIKVYKEILANSVYMQDRNLTSITKTIETYSASNQNTTPVKAYFGGVTKGFNYYVNFLMYAVKVGDKAAIMFGGMPNYSYYKAKFKKKYPKATEQEAIDYAITNFEADTKDTQQSSDLQDKSYWQTEVPAISFLNLFKTSQKQYFRKQRDAFRQLRRMTMAMDTKAGKGGFFQNVRTLVLYHSVMPLLFKYVSLGLPGLWADWGEDDTEELAWAAALGNVGALLIVAEITEAAVSASQGKPWAANAKSLPILEMVADYMRVKMYRDKAANAKKPNPETVAKWQKQMDMNLLEFSTLPVRKVDKIYKNLEKISKGDVDGPGDFMLKLFAFGDSVIEGDNKKKPSKTKQTDINPIFIDEDDDGKFLPPA